MYFSFALAGHRGTPTPITHLCLLLLCFFAMLLAYQADARTNRRANYWRKSNGRAKKTSPLKNFANSYHTKFYTIVNRKYEKFYCIMYRIKHHAAFDCGNLAVLRYQKFPH